MRHSDSYGNAMAEPLNGTFKAELIEMQGPWSWGRYPSDRQIRRPGRAD